MGEKDNEMISVQDQNQWEGILETEVSYSPSVNIYETGDNFVMLIDMPGIERKNIGLKIEGDSLLIFGKINFDEAVSKKYILTESSVGHYFRRFNLSDNIDLSGIEASYENGRLTVTLPKHERIKPKVIKID